QRPHRRDERATAGRLHGATIEHEREPLRALGDIRTLVEALALRATGRFPNGRVRIERRRLKSFLEQFTHDCFRYHKRRCGGDRIALLVGAGARIGRALGRPQAGGGGIVEAIDDALAEVITPRRTDLLWWSIHFRHRRHLDLRRRRWWRRHRIDQRPARRGVNLRLRRDRRRNGDRERRDAE